MQIGAFSETSLWKLDRRIFETKIVLMNLQRRLFFGLLRF